MDGNQKGMQDAVQRAWNYHVKHGLDGCLVTKIAKNCGSNSLKGAESWLRFVKFHAGKRFYGISIDGTAFLFGSFAKKHFRLAEIAVEKQNQKKGYGKLLLSILFEECLKRNIFSVTFRTSKNENAYLWYLSLGAKLTGEKQDDYEMRFDI